MRHRWETLTFLHWAYPIAEVQALLPAGLTVEPWGGSAWVGLVPFHMLVRPPVGPAVPRLTTFPETNVRTYVTGPNGLPGVWFFSLDATNLPAVAAARITYGLPYFPARMRVRSDGDAVYYRSERLTRDRAAHDIALRPGEALAADEIDGFVNYLTARFRLWSVNQGLLLMSNAEHPPWSLRTAAVTRLEQDLVQRAGLSPPHGEPLVHFSAGVDVRIGRPHAVSRAGLGP
jgi:uncharacterized protein YqjF (DUF2071 family)